MAKLSKDLEVAIDKVDAFDASVASMTMDACASAPKVESEPQVLQSQREIAKEDGLYLKPDRSINSKESFNEKYRTEYNYKKEYVPFIAEHKEIIGETIELWTKPFAGLSAEFWKVPTNKKVWGPRHLAEQISSKSYTRITMNEQVTTGSDGHGVYFGQLTAANRIQRLDARPARGSKQAAMASDF